MKKIKKTIATMFCMLFAAVPNNISAIKNKYSFCLNDNSYDQMFAVAKNASLTGYAAKKGLITGKINLVPISINHYNDWMRIFDCSTQEDKNYLKYWVWNLKNLNNKYMESSFTNAVMSTMNCEETIGYMIEFCECKDKSINEEQIKTTKTKFEEPKTVGYIYLHKKNKDNLLSGYVIDKNYNGRGIASNALKLIVDLSSSMYKKNISPCKYINLQIEKENKPSEHVASNCGFIKTNEKSSGPFGYIYTWKLNLDKYPTTQIEKSSKIKKYAGLGTLGALGVFLAGSGLKFSSSVSNKQKYQLTKLKEKEKKRIRQNR